MFVPLLVPVWAAHAAHEVDRLDGVHTTPPSSNPVFNAILVASSCSLRLCDSASIYRLALRTEIKSRTSWNRVHRVIEFLTICAVRVRHVVRQTKLAGVGRTQQRTSPRSILVGYDNLNGAETIDRQAMCVSQRLASHGR